MLFSQQVIKVSLRPVTIVVDLLAILIGVESGWSVSKKDSEDKKWCEAAESSAARAGSPIVVLQAA